VAQPLMLDGQDQEASPDLLDVLWKWAYLKVRTDRLAGRAPEIRPEVVDRLRLAVRELELAAVRDLEERPLRVDVARQVRPVRVGTRFVRSVAKRLLVW
jgi:hypothetical protein